MAYLIIIVVVGLIGITRLWLAQRREASQLDTIEGFSTALQKISPDTPLPAPKEASGRRSRMRRRTRKTAPRRTRGAAPRARKVASQRAHTQPPRRRRPASQRANAQVARRRRTAPPRRRRRVTAVRATNVQSLDRRRRYEARRRIEARRRSQAS